MVYKLFVQFSYKLKNIVDNKPPNRYITNRGELTTMHEKLSDLIYAARNLCEGLRDKQDLLDDELKEFLEETEACLDKFSDEEDDDLFE